MLFSLIILHLFAPLFVLFQLGIQKFSSRMESLASIILGSGVMIVLTMIGNWGWFSIFLLVIYWGLLVFALTRAVRRYAGIAVLAPETASAWMGFSISLVLGALAWAGVVISWAGYTLPPQSVDLEFPYHEGVFLVGHGGNKKLINHHNSHASQKFALDIGQLYFWGGRASGLYPDSLDQYAIYQSEIYAPCTGKVAGLVNDLPDQQPKHFDRDNPAGNYLAIECNGITVYLAHFSAGSITVEVGDRVDQETMIGLTGNSGNTSEPHLHIHAEQGGWSGEFSGNPGVPISFNGRFLVRNSLVFAD